MKAVIFGRNTYKRTKTTEEKENCYTKDDSRKIQRESVIQELEFSSFSHIEAREAEEEQSSTGKSRMKQTMEKILAELVYNYLEAMTVKCHHLRKRTT